MVTNQLPIGIWELVRIGPVTGRRTGPTDFSGPTHWEPVGGHKDRRTRPQLKQ